MSAILREATTDDMPDGPVDRRARLWADVFCCVFDVDPDDECDETAD
jgi:hypothetical protein